MKKVLVATALIGVLGAGSVFAAEVKNVESESCFKLDQKQDRALDICMETQVGANELSELLACAVEVDAELNDNPERELEREFRLDTNEALKVRPQISLPKLG